MRRKRRKGGITLVYLDKPEPPKKRTRTMNTCLFDSLIDETARPRPCKRCAKRKRPFSFRSNEIGSPFKWWTADLKNGNTITFRTAKGQKPEQRIEAIADEYRNSWDSYVWSYIRRWSANRARGRMWGVSLVNALFGPVTRPGDVKAYRPATPCEIMGWFATHQEDLYCLDDFEAVLAKMQTFMPPLVEIEDEDDG